MKKAILAVCAAVVFLACTMLTTVTVGAVDRSCNHVMNSEIDGIWETSYTHPYMIDDPQSGSIYGTCHVRNVNFCRYSKCSLCGYVEYNHPTNIQVVESVHDSCELSGNN